MEVFWEEEGRKRPKVYCTTYGEMEGEGSCFYCFFWVWEVSGVFGVFCFVLSCFGCFLGGRGEERRQLVVCFLGEGGRGRFFFVFEVFF